MTRAALAVASALVVLAPRAAIAQLHADVDVEAGAAQRLLSSRAAGAGVPGVGPRGELSGHVAVLPLLRAGAYADFDLSPISGEDTRQFLSAGISGRLYSPWPRGTWRVWLGSGFGYAAAHAPAFAEVPSSSGGFFEVPVGLGASLRLSRSFELVGEAGTRIGFAFTGSMYNRVPTEGGLAPAAPPAGNDSFGVFVVGGLAFEL